MPNRGGARRIKISSHVGGPLIALLVTPPHLVFLLAFTMDFLGNLGQKAFDTVRDALDPVVQASQPVPSKPIISILPQRGPETKQEWADTALNTPAKRFINVHTGTILGIEHQGGLGACGQEARDGLADRQTVRPRSWSDPPEGRSRLMMEHG
jgi:hypothetical protein